MDKKQIKFNSDTISVSLDSKSHSNKLLLVATIMKLGEFSDEPPCGSDGNRIVLEQQEAQEALNTMNFMGVNCVWDDSWSRNDLLSGHDVREIVGVVQRAYIEDNCLKAEIIIYKQNYPDLCEFVINTVSSIGFSIEANCNFEEVEGGYKMSDVEFTGVAMLFKNLAAYQTTEIEKVVAKAKGKNTVEKAELKEMFEEFKAELKAEKDAEQAKKAAAKKDAELESAKTKCKEAEDKVAELEKEVADLKEQLAEAKAKKDSKTKAEAEPIVEADLDTKGKLQASKLMPKNAGFADMVLAHLG